MQKKFLYIVLVFISTTVNAQVSDGKIGSLVAAENYFSGLASREGVRKAFLKLTTDETVLFRPDPIKARTFFKDQPDVPGSTLSWYPVYAQIAKSGDWGFTTGPFVAKTATGEEGYGQYCSVWKVN